MARPDRLFVEQTEDARRGKDQRGPSDALLYAYFDKLTGLTPSVTARSREASTSVNQSRRGSVVVNQSRRGSVAVNQNRRRSLAVNQSRRTSAASIHSRQASIHTLQENSPSGRWSHRSSYSPWENIGQGEVIDPLQIQRLAVSNATAMRGVGLEQIMEKVEKAESFNLSKSSSHIIESPVHFQTELLQAVNHPNETPVNYDELYRNDEGTELAQAVSDTRSLYRKNSKFVNYHQAPRLRALYTNGTIYSANLSSRTYYGEVYVQPNAFINSVKLLRHKRILKDRALVRRRKLYRVSVNQYVIYDGEHIIIPTKYKLGVYLSQIQLRSDSNLPNVSPSYNQQTQVQVRPQEQSSAHYIVQEPSYEQNLEYFIQPISETPVERKQFQLEYQNQEPATFPHEKSQHLHQVVKHNGVSPQSYVEENRPLEQLEADRQSANSAVDEEHFQVELKFNNQVSTAYSVGEESFKSKSETLLAEMEYNQRNCEVEANPIHLITAETVAPVPVTKPCLVISRADAACEAITYHHRAEDGKIYRGKPFNLSTDINEVAKGSDGKPKNVSHRQREMLTDTAICSYTDTEKIHASTMTSLEKTESKK